MHFSCFVFKDKGILEGEGAWLHGEMVGGGPKVWVTQTTQSSWLLSVLLRAGSLIPYM